MVVVVPAPVVPRKRTEEGTQLSRWDHKVERVDKGEEGVP